MSTAEPTAAVIKGIKLVFDPVSDQDRAIDFYTRALGFELATDQPYGEGIR